MYLKGFTYILVIYSVIACMCGESDEQAFPFLKL